MKKLNLTQKTERNKCIYQKIKKIDNYRKQCLRCNRNTLLPYEYEFIRIACPFNVILQKNEFSEMQRTKIHFINRLKDAEQKIFCICIDGYGKYQGNDYD